MFSRQGIWLLPATEEKRHALIVEEREFAQNQSGNMCVSGDHVLHVRGEMILVQQLLRHQDGFV